MTETNSSTAECASLRRRILCLVYEAFVLFGVFFAAGLIFDLITQNFDPSAVRTWRQIYLFIVLGAYFTYFWGHGGQTLPMQTWNIKVVSKDLSTVTFRQACIRYCVAWMWFVPALVIIEALNIQRWPSLVIVLSGILLWSLTAKLDKNGQFLHDKLAGTRLVFLSSKPVNQ